MLICACGCGTHVYSTCTGPGNGLRTGACLLHFACVRAVRCSAWIVRAVVYLECVCVCVRQSVCVARFVPLVQRFVCQRGSRALCILARVGSFVQYFAQRGSRALCVLARVGTSCWYLFCTVLRLVSQTRANVPSLPYPLRSSLGYHGR